jgi:hypothetical protein
MPARKRKQPVEMFPLKLTLKRRNSLVPATRLLRCIKTGIEEVPRDQRFVEFTKKVLEKMAKEIDTSLDFVLPDELKRLNAVIDKIDDLLADSEEKAFRSTR